MVRLATRIGLKRPWAAAPMWPPTSVADAPRIAGIFAVASRERHKAAAVLQNEAEAGRKGRCYALEITMASGPMRWGGALRYIIFRLALVLFLAAAPGAADAASTPAYIVVDADSGKVLSHRSADHLWYPASITKVMTAYVIFRALQEDTITTSSPVRISKNALAQPASKMGFKVGTVMTVDNAIKMMIVRSANDIAVALGEAVAGTENKFVARMNAEAERLGMSSTRFSNPNGLPDDKQWSTARDLAVLARAVWTDFPEYRDYFEIPAIRVGKRVLRSHNTLLERYRGANGMKTGYICSSGFNMVGSATRKGRTVMVVVLGSDSSKERAELAAGLLNRGFASWLSIGGRPLIESFRARKVAGSPVNHRERICSPAARQKRAQNRNVKPKKSALVPRFVLMDPVRVFTGRAKPPPSRVPLPRLRPDRGERRASLDGEPALVQ